MVQDDLGLQTWRVNIFPWYTLHRESVFLVNLKYGNTVEPVYNRGHPFFQLDLHKRHDSLFFNSLMVRNVFWIGSSLFRSRLVIG